MRGAAWLFFASSLWAANEECTPCHAAIVTSYNQTGMGRSIIERPDPFSASYYHRLSNRHYTAANGALRRHQLDAQRREINVVEKSIHFAIGSGNHAVTYVHRTPQGRLLELPLSWYRSLNAWAMSPGYDSTAHLDMRREISDACLFCHAAYPTSPAARAAPKSIDCARCHGDTTAHLKKPARGTILNPAHLAPGRRLEVCLQCHLETVSQGIADSFRQPRRGTFSFRPGEPLENYKLYFDRADSPDTRLEVNHSGYRLLQSACYQQSPGKLTCTTCHDPHTAKARNACAQCHPAPRHASPSGPDCTSCHMPKRPTNDAPHVAMTNHRIRARPTAPQPDHAPYRGPVVPFYTKADPETLAMANIQVPGAEAAAIYRRRLARDPTDTAARAALANTLLRLGRREEAMREARRILTLDENHTSALNTLGVAHAMHGEHAQALAIFLRAKDSNPDHSLTWLNLGVTYQAMNQPNEAIQSFREAIRLQPDFSEARQRLAALP
ncbi:MAG: tetratricopeptide repeat protein [Bryobacterales bacterium]|nr:tetratricopeptide repeat protein [Bryobacterales bacterium]